MRVFCLVPIRLVRLLFWRSVPFVEKFAYSQSWDLLLLYEEIFVFMRTIFRSRQRDSFVLIFSYGGRFGYWTGSCSVSGLEVFLRREGFSISKGWWMLFFLNILSSMNVGEMSLPILGWFWGDFVRVGEFYTGDSLLGLITNLLWARFITWGKNGIIMDQNHERAGRLQIPNVIIKLTTNQMVENYERVGWQ